MQTTFRKLTVAWPLVIFSLLPALTRAETAIQAWVQRYNGLGNSEDRATAMAVDGSSNVIVTGYSRLSTAYGTEDYATIKYSSAGVPLWTNRYNGPGNSEDYAYAVAVDGSNNVIVTGYSYGSASGPDYATIKYSSAGVPLWTNRYNGPGNSADQAYAVAVDGSNNVDRDRVFVERNALAITRRSSIRARACRSGPTATTDREMVMTKLYALAVDGSNNVIVTGYSTGSGSGRDYATIKYSSDGVPLWTNRYNGPGNSDDYAQAVAADGSDNVIVTGYRWGRRKPGRLHDDQVF